MKLALLPCVAIAVVVAGCNDDDGGASPAASVRVGAPTRRGSQHGVGDRIRRVVAATETESGEPTWGRVAIETTDTTVPPRISTSTSALASAPTATSAPARTSNSTAASSTATTGWPPAP